MPARAAECAQAGAQALARSGAQRYRGDAAVRAVDEPINTTVAELCAGFPMRPAFEARAERGAAHVAKRGRIDGRSGRCPWRAGIFRSLRRSHEPVPTDSRVSGVGESNPAVGKLL